MKSGKIKASAIMSIIMALIMIMTMMPAAAFAEGGSSGPESAEVTVEEKADDSSGEGSGKVKRITETGNDEIDGADPEVLMEKFLYTKDSAAGISLLGRLTPKAPLSIKGERLTGRNQKYYKYYKKIIREVVAGKRTNTTIKVKLTKITGKRKFTARELGVKRIGYKKNGKWYVTDAAQKKIMKLLMPQNWMKVYQGVLSDMSSDSYWVDWYGDERFFNWNAAYHYNANTITFDKGDWIEFSLPVMPEFAKNKNIAYKYIYKVDSNKISSANEARANARKIVASFDDAIPTTFAGYSAEAIDYYRMLYYCAVIADLNTYDHHSASLPENERYWRGPWSLISVFDNDTTTNAVCAGYARAFKYLCDLSTFESDWIDCQIATGSAGGEDTSHMWNIVRMNDGENYVVDPTWMDDDYNNTITDDWFLRGTANGSTEAFTIEGNYRTYDDWTKSTYAPAERLLSVKDRYEFTTDRPIVLNTTKIAKLSGKKKAFTVKWKKMSTALGALYVNGYQIQYSTKKSFSSAKTVTVKGYNNTSKTIKKLKSGKKYYVRIRTYAKAGGNTYYSDWSAKKKVKIK